MAATTYTADGHEGMEDYLVAIERTGSPILIQDYNTLRSITVPTDATLAIASVCAGASDLTVTLNSVEFTLATQDSEYFTSLYYLVNPSTGSQTFEVSKQVNAVIIQFYKGIDTSSPTRDTDVDNDASSASTPNMTSVSGDMAIAACTCYGSDIDMDNNGQTAIATARIGSEDPRAGLCELAATGTTIHIEATGTWPSIAAAVFKLEASGGASPNKLDRSNPAGISRGMFKRMVPGSGQYP